MAVVEVRDLAKSYGGTEALRGVSFDIAEGEVFALLGPNGAGKSSTIEILEGHRTSTAGTVSVLGVDPAEAGREFRDRIGIVLQSSGIESAFTVREAVAEYASVYRRPRSVDEVIDLVGLTEKADDRVKTLSGGQQRRIDLALGIIGDPDVLFLDEPTTGFDPAARRRSWDLVAGLRSEGTTVLLTTHYMDEAQHLADRVGVIVDGRIVALGTPADLMSATAETRISCRVRAGVTVPAGLLSDHRHRRHDESTARAAASTMIELSTARPTVVLHELTAWAIGEGIELEDVLVDRPTLEDVYLALAEVEPSPSTATPPGRPGQ